MISIGVNNFFPGETIVVTPLKTTNIQFWRVIADWQLCGYCKPELAGNIRSIIRASKEAKHKPTQIPAHVVNSRNDALQYLGFRHISGVQRWDPLAKARYLKLLFERTSDELGPEQRCIEVALEIGSRSNAVQRNLDALAAYEAIEKRDFFDIEDLDEGSFSSACFTWQ